MDEQGNQDEPDQAEPEIESEHPYKQWIVSSITSIHRDLKALYQARLSVFRDKAKKAKRDLIISIDSIDIEEMLKKAGLEATEANGEIDECLARCSTKLSSLRSQLK